MNYKKTYVPAKGYTKLCQIGQCSLKKLEFGIIELDAGEKLPFYTEDRAETLTPILGLLFRSSSISFHFVTSSIMYMMGSNRRSLLLPCR